jgi:hypothetical protein
MIDRTGNLPLFPGIFPDYAASIAIAVMGVGALATVGALGFDRYRPTTRDRR